jgi:hypothetical protein
MSGLGIAALLGGRFDMVRGLRGDARDEYWGESTSTRRPSQGTS